MSQHVIPVFSTENDKNQFKPISECLDFNETKGEHCNFELPMLMLRFYDESNTIVNVGLFKFNDRIDQKNNQFKVFLDCVELYCDYVRISNDCSDWIFNHPMTKDSSISLNIGSFFERGKMRYCSYYGNIHPGNYQFEVSSIPDLYFDGTGFFHACRMKMNSV